MFVNEQQEMYNLGKGCDKLMVTNLVMEKHSEYAAVDYDGLWKKLIHLKRKLFRFILQQNDDPQEVRRLYISALIYFIDYLLQIPKELTEKLRNELILSQE